MNTFILFATLALSTWQAKVTGYLANCEGCTGYYARVEGKAHWTHRSIGVTDAAEAGKDPKLPRMETGSRWKITFREPEKAPYTLVYTVRDRCPPEHWHYPKGRKPYKEGCGAGHFDVLTSSNDRATILGGLVVSFQKAK